MSKASSQPRIVAASSVEPGKTLASRQLALSRKPVVYLRFKETEGTVAVDETGHGHDGAISGYKDLILSRSGLLSYYRFEEMLGTQAVDSGPLVNHGTYAGGYSLGQPGPLLDPDLALACDGVNGRVTIPDNASTRFAGRAAFSLECWVKPTHFGGINGFPRLLSKEHFSPNRFGLLMVLNDAGAGGTLAANRWNQGAFLGGSTTAAGTIVAGAWQHCVWTYDGTNHRLYINGVLRAGPSANDIGALDSTTDVWSVGALTGGGGPYAGLADEVGFYNIVLTATDVLNRYNAGMVTRPVTRGAASPILGDPTDRAFAFDGISGRVDLPYDAALNPAQWSIGAWWFESAGQDANDPIWDCRPASSGALAAGFDLFLNVASGIGISVCSTNVAQTIILWAPSIVLGTWHRTWATYDGTKVRLYGDGALRNGPTTCPYTPNPSRASAIGHLTGGANWAQAVVDEVELLDYALPLEEVQRDWAAAFGSMMVLTEETQAAIAGVSTGVKGR